MLLLFFSPDEAAAEEQPKPEKQRKGKKAYADIDVAALLAGDEETPAPEPVTATGARLFCVFL